MRHVTFALVLTVLILSSGLTNAMDIWPDGGTTTINVNVPFDITIMASNKDYVRSGWSSPFMFSGTGDVTTITGATFALDPTFLGFWDLLADSAKESWDGNLTVPDQFNFTGIGMSNGFPNDGVAYPCFTFTFTIPGDATTAGTFCIEQGDFTKDTYDWLFNDPVPIFTKTCWPVVSQPNEAPDFDDCPVVDIQTQWNEQTLRALAISDAEGNLLTDVSVSANVAVNGTFDVTITDATTADGGEVEFTFSPTCDDVGSIEFTVGATDATHAIPTGKECVFTVTVENTAPTIDCPTAPFSVTAGNTKDVYLSATDVNTGDTQVWSVVNVTPTPDQGTDAYSINAAGVLSFSPNDNDDGIDYIFAVRVTDCAGDFDECEVTFHVVSEMPFDIVIEKDHGLTGQGVFQGHHDYLDVTKMEGSEEMHGFDFLIGYDASALAFVGAISGVLFDMTGDYQWEYFTYRYNWNGNCGSGCPTGLLRVIGMAEQNDGPHHPVSVMVANGTVLFTLDFLISNDRTLECQFVPVHFYWMDCGDNTIAFRYGAGEPFDIKTAVSKNVYHYWGDTTTAAVVEYGEGYYEVTDGTFGFPTYYGIQDHCLTMGDPQLGKEPIPFIRFFDGGFDIICADSIDVRGDVNLNGIPNEIGDVLVFTNYFIHGLSAFTVNVEGQIAATEVNGDGIVLSVADLVYLIRIVVGDAQPIPKVAPNITADFIADGSVVSVDTELGAAYFVLAGDVNVSLADGAAGMEILSGFDGANTRVLIYSFEKGRTAYGNVLNTYGNVISVEAADYNGNAYKTAILPAEFGLKNYPNPFNPVTTIELSLPVASDWIISVFNVAGQKVASFSGYSEAGVITFEWEASDQASGIYFYKAEAGKFSATKKMVLLK